MLNALLCIVVFALAAASDYLETRYVLAVGAGASEAAARASVLMWVVGAIGLAACVEFGWWLLAPEGLGLYVGTRIAMER